MSRQHRVLLRERFSPSQWDLLESLASGHVVFVRLDGGDGVSDARYLVAARLADGMVEDGWVRLRVTATGLRTYELAAGGAR